MVLLCEVIDAVGACYPPFAVEPMLWGDCPSIWDKFSSHEFLIAWSTVSGYRPR